MALVGTPLIVILLASSIGLISPSFAASVHSNSPLGPSTLPGTTFVSGPPTGSKGPDDITLLATEELNDGRALIWTAFQNGINPDGTPAVSYKHLTLPTICSV